MVESRARWPSSIHVHPFSRKLPSPQYRLLMLVTFLFQTPLSSPLSPPSLFPNVFSLSLPLSVIVCFSCAFDMTVHAALPPCRNHVGRGTALVLAGEERRVLPAAICKYSTANPCCGARNGVEAWRGEYRARTVYRAHSLAHPLTLL